MKMTHEISQGMLLKNQISIIFNIDTSKVYGDLAKERLLHKWFTCKEKYGSSLGVKKL